MAQAMTHGQEAELIRHGPYTREGKSMTDEARSRYTVPGVIGSTCLDRAAGLDSKATTMDKRRNQAESRTLCDISITTGGTTNIKTAYRQSRKPFLFQFLLFSVFLYEQLIAQNIKNVFHF